MLVGTVTELDEAVGLGTVTAAGGGTHRFHVVEIADGTRSVDVGRTVTFELLPKFGRYEAGSLAKV